MYLTPAKGVIEITKILKMVIIIILINIWAVPEERKGQACLKDHTRVMVVVSSITGKQKKDHIQPEFAFSLFEMLSSWRLGKESTKIANRGTWHFSAGLLGWSLGSLLGRILLNSSVGNSAKIYSTPILLHLSNALAHGFLTMGTINVAILLTKKLTHDLID